MKDGFIKVCAATPDIRVADCNYNADRIIEIMKEQAELVKILVFPELVLTGYTCQDLFLQDLLLEEARVQLRRIIKESDGIKMLLFLGLPFSVHGKLYNVAAAIHDGHLVGLIPKKYIPGYAEFYETRHFYARAEDDVEWLTLPEFGMYCVPFGRNLLFQCREIKELCVAAEICEDLWAPVPPSSFHAVYGATVIVNLTASDDNTGKDDYRRDLVKSQSARLVCGYIYACAGEGESTQDLVFSAHNLICENGSVLAEAKRFENGCITTELDVRRLISDRRKMTTFHAEGIENSKRHYDIIAFSLSIEQTSLTRRFPQKPFVPSIKAERERRCEEILTIQALGLKKRLKHTHCKSAVIGISGGLDSTLALLVTVKAFDMLKMDRKQIIAVTMPCFGTTDRTYHNAVELSERLKVTLLEVPIKDAVNQHFQDIGHDPSVHDVTYENSQARMRTMVLMDIANQKNGMVIGTGDMSELALGWATYNGDHMSMYGVNSSVPKTLVRYLVAYYAQTVQDKKVQELLLDVLDTPVSPELLPPKKDGEIAQKTEDLVGPYELHDFYLYYCLRFGMMPSKIFRLACEAFQGIYSKDMIYQWLKTFYYRFFTQQFKRSCLPDGPKVGTVCVSPRGDLRMPSDAMWDIWKEDLEKIYDNEKG